MMTIVAVLAIIATSIFLLVHWRSYPGTRKSYAASVTKGVSRHEQVVMALCSATILLSAWQIMSDAVRDSLFLPTPYATGEAFWALWTTGSAARDAAVTIARVLIAVGVAACIGMTVGILAAVFPRFGALVLPANSAARYIPPTAFISLTVLYFGINEAGKLALIFLAIVWYIVQMTFDVVRQVPRVLIESAEMLGARRTELLSRVVFPYCLPELAAVLRVNLGAAWTYVVVAELVAAQSGLGYSLALSQRLLQTPRVFAIIIIISLVGFLSDSALAILIRWLGRWK